MPNARAALAAADVVYEIARRWLGKPVREHVISVGETGTRGPSARVG